jgi:hypothetical protein
MESWITVVVAAIVALSTLAATWLQNRHSDRRFSVELQITQQRELEARQKELRERRREVRSETLRKLRDELSRMASKLDKLVAISSRQNIIMIGGTEEEAKRELQLAIEDWNTYLASGNFTQTLFTQYDAELVKKIESVREDYQASALIALLFPVSKDVKTLIEAVKTLKKNLAKIIEIQELINKRLEEL